MFTVCSVVLYGGLRPPFREADGKVRPEGDGQSS